MQPIFSHFCYPLSLFPESFHTPNSSSYPTTSHLLLGTWRGRRDGKRGEQGQQSRAQPWQSTALLTCCFSLPAELVLRALKAAQCHCPPAKALSPAGQSSLMKPSWASLTLYQVPQGWQRLLVKHRPRSAHWRVKAVAEGCRVRHVQAAEAALRNGRGWHRFPRVTLLTRGSTKKELQAPAADDSSPTEEAYMVLR